MVEYSDESRVITHIEPSKKLEDRIESITNVYLWEIDNKKRKLVNPEPVPRKLVIPLNIPTKRFSNDRFPEQEDDLIKQLSLLKDHLTGKYNSIIFSNQIKLNKIKNKETKSAKKLANKISFLEKAKQTLDNKISYKIIKTKNKSHFLLRLPHLAQTEMSFLSNYLDYKSRFSSNSFLVRRAIGSEMNVLNLTDKEFTSYSESGPHLKVTNLKDYETGKIIYNTFTFVDSDILKRSKKLSLDEETTDWQKVNLSKLEKMLSKKELIDKFDLDKKLETQNKEKLLSIAEKKKDSKRDERITIITLADVENDFYEILTTFSYEKVTPKYPGDIPENIIFPKLIKFDNQKLMLDYLNNLYKKYGHLWGEGHNHMSFDYQKFKELGAGTFFAGTDGSKPKFVPGTKFKTFVFPRGRFDIDPSTYFQYVAPWTVSNRLDHVFEDITGIYDEKIMNHAELEANMKFALDSNNSIEKRMVIINDLHSYGIIDPVKSYIICKSLIDEILMKSRIFKCSPTRNSTTSRKSFIGEYWTNWNLDNKGLFLYTNPDKDWLSITSNLKRLKSYREDKKRLSWKDFSLEEFQSRLIDYYLREKLQGDELENGTVFTTYKALYQKGRFKRSKIIHFHPIIAALKDFFKDDKEVMNLYNYEFENSKQQIRAYKSLEWILEYPFFKLMQYSDEKLTKEMKLSNEIAERNFSSDFNLGFDNTPLKDYHNKLVKYFQSVARGLKDIKIINSYRNFYLIENNEENMEFARKLKEYNFATVFSDVDALSIDKGKFVAKQGKQLMSFGISNPRSKQGEKNELEKELMYSVLRKLFVEDDFENVLKEIRNASNKTQLGIIDPKLLEYERVARRHFTEYSSAANQKAIKELIKRKARKGEKIIYTKEFDDLTSKMFGYILTGKKESLYELTNNKSILKDLLFATIPRNKDDVFLEERLNLLFLDVLTGRATDEEIADANKYYLKNVTNN
jgi:hypothetical protein